MDSSGAIVLRDANMATGLTLDKQTFFDWVSQPQFREAIGLENFQTYRKAMNDRLHTLERRIQDLEASNRQITQRLEMVEAENRELKNVSTSVSNPNWPNLGSTKTVINHTEDPVKSVPRSAPVKASLTQKNDHLQASSNSINQLRISGLPEAEPDNQGVIDTKQQVCDFIKKDMKLIIKQQNIISAHRIGLRKVDQDKPRTILVEFANDWSKTEIYNERMSLRKIEGCRVYINENLTKDKNNLLIHARKLKNEGKIHTAFSRDCEIFVKKLPSSVPVQVYKQEDIDHLILPATASKPEDPAKGIQVINISKSTIETEPKLNLGRSTESVSSSTMNTAVHESSLISQESAEALFKTSIDISKNDG